MKRLALLLILLSVGMFAFGCGESGAPEKPILVDPGGAGPSDEAADEATPAEGEAADEAAPAEGEAADEAAPAEGEAAAEEAAAPEAKPEQ